MGSSCCGNLIKDEELIKAKNIDDIIKILENRIPLLSEEKEQIKQHLVDHKTEVYAIYIDDIKDDNLKMRIPFLAQIIEVYGELIDLLKNNKNLDIYETKIRINSIFDKYYIVYDPNNDLLNELKDFRIFVNNNKRI